MDVKATSTKKGKRKQGSTSDLIAKQVIPLVVPIRDDTDTTDGIVAGFRQHMLDIGDPEKNGGSVCSGAGLGNDFITLQWCSDGKERRAILRGSEILRAWVATFDPGSAAKFPEEVKAVEGP